MSRILVVNAGSTSLKLHAVDEEGHSVPVDSLDVAPTLLGLLGRPYETLFFGRDLLSSKPPEGRVLLHHNRDIGMMAHDRLVVLGLMQTVEFYQGNPKVVDVSLLSNPTDSDRELEKDAMAIYQVADDLYTHQNYRVNPQAAPGAREAEPKVSAMGRKPALDATP